MCTKTSRLRHLQAYVCATYLNLYKDFIFHWSFSFSRLPTDVINLSAWRLTSLLSAAHTPSSMPCLTHRLRPFCHWTYPRFCFPLLLRPAHVFQLPFSVIFLRSSSMSPYRGLSLQIAYWMHLSIGMILTWTIYHSYTFPQRCLVLQSRSILQNNLFITHIAAVLTVLY